MPLVRKFVGKLFGRVPDTSINPDEAVALGAAIQAAMKERKEAVKEVILTDVCPFTLGTEVSVKTENDHLEGNHFCPISREKHRNPGEQNPALFYCLRSPDTGRNTHITGREPICLKQCFPWNIKTYRPG